METNPWILSSQKRRAKIEKETGETVIEEARCRMEETTLGIAGPEIRTTGRETGVSISTKVEDPEADPPVGKSVLKTGPRVVPRSTSLATIEKCRS